MPLGYFSDDEDVILIASNYGQARHPSWYYNLLKNPQCQVFPEGPPTAEVISWPAPPRAKTVTASSLSLKATRQTSRRTR